jgi:Domain of unknown function (DUF932)
MLNLMLHCGSQAVERSEVIDSSTPEATKTWQPIRHSRLLDLAEDTPDRTGLKVVNQAHALARDGDRYFGLLEVQNGQQADDYGLVVGLRNSHDQTFPAGLVMGSGVFICENLAFSGEIVLSRRHTVHIERDLPQLVNRAVGQLGDLRIQQDTRIDAYKNTRLEKRDAHHLLVEAMRMRVLPATRLPFAVKEFEEPSHGEFRDAGATAWTLFNAVTESIKGRSLDTLPKRTQALHGLLDSACGLVA